MKPEQRRPKYVAAFLVGLAVMAGVLFARDFLSLTDRAETFAALCDACFVPGVLLVGVGALLFVSNDGLFDIFTFNMQRLMQLSRRKERRGETPHTFFDYRMMKHGGRKAGFGFLLGIGAVYLVAAVVFLWLSEGM